jgi:hypothetical protein
MKEKQKHRHRSSQGPSVVGTESIKNLVGKESRRRVASPHPPGSFFNEKMLPDFCRLPGTKTFSNRNVFIKKLRFCNGVSRKLIGRGTLMKGSRVYFAWENPPALRDFRTAVSLHGHTMHSQECLSFLPRYLHRIPGVSQVARRYQQPALGAGPAVDFSRAYWTPPLNPAAALRLERGQIERLGLQPLVSLTDHDDVEAGLALQMSHDRVSTPVSVEWTVPYGASILHLGIHNLPACSERGWLVRWVNIQRPLTRLACPRY